MTWRVGRKIPKNLYEDDADVGRMDTPELAARVVAAMNAMTLVADVEEPRVYRYEPDMWASWCPCGRGETGWDEARIREALNEHLSECLVQKLRLLAGVQ